MPWRGKKDVQRHNKKCAEYLDCYKLWLKVANKYYDSTGDDAQAVIRANVAAKKWLQQHGKYRRNMADENVRGLERAFIATPNAATANALLRALQRSNTEPSSKPVADELLRQYMLQRDVPYQIRNVNNDPFYIHEIPIYSESLGVTHRMRLWVRIYPNMDVTAERVLYRPTSEGEHRFENSHLAMGANPFLTVIDLLSHSIVPDHDKLVDIIKSELETNLPFKVVRDQRHETSYFETENGLDPSHSFDMELTGRYYDRLDVSLLLRRATNDTLECRLQTNVMLSGGWDTTRSEVQGAALSGNAINAFGFGGDIPQYQENQFSDIDIVTSLDHLKILLRHYVEHLVNEGLIR